VAEGNSNWPVTYTIDELARLSGTTTRNLRAFQSRGLLAAPVLDGRTGRYDDRHRSDVATIVALQRRGFSLAAIGELLSAWREGLTVGQVLGREPMPTLHRPTASRGRPPTRSPTRSQPGSQPGSQPTRRPGAPDADVIFLDDLRHWRIPRGDALALLPGSLSQR
jgi:DNA-binding transcriptional MerR regulator